MIVGRNPRNAVIGDTALLRADNRRGVGTIVDTGHPGAVQRCRED
jgi:regulator of RNase E activity RraA